MNFPAQTIQTPRKTGVFLLVSLTAFGCCLLPASGQTNWTKYDNTIPTNSDTTTTNGRIALGTANTGDDTNITYFAMIRDADDQLYKIWYSGDPSNSAFRGYYATSPDGLTWTKYDNTIPADSDVSSTNGKIPLGSLTRGDDGGVYPGSVIKDGPNSYKMWYTGSDGVKQRIFYATSTDGVTWVKYDNTISPASDGVCTNGKIALGTSGSGDDWWANRPTVIKDNGVYKMWYTGYDGNAQYTVSVYYATSPDGLTWTKYNNTIPTNSDTTSTDGRVPPGTSGKGDWLGVQAPCVIKVGSTYHMWYSAYGGPNRIYYATSPDGLTWTKLNNNTPANSDTTSTDGRIPLGASGGDTEHALAPRVVRVREGDSYKYKMWYTGRASNMWRLYHATAPEPPPPAGTVFYFR